MGTIVYFRVFSKILGFGEVPFVAGPPGFGTLWVGGRRGGFRKYLTYTMDKELEV